MKNNGFSLFQTLIALFIVSTSLMFILQMTIRNLRVNNDMAQSIQNLNEQINSFEILLADKNQ